MAAHKAGRKVRKDERASREQQQKWFEAVERQKARGEAGFASEAEARAALRGKGGPASSMIAGSDARPKANRERDDENHFQVGI